MHHFAWGVVCLILLMSMGGLWVHAQTLSVKLANLEKKLIETQKPTASTCKVGTHWQGNSTVTLSTGDRQFNVHLPENFSHNQYYPMVLFYPGRGSTAEVGQAKYGFDALPAVVVYPQPTKGIDGDWAWQSAPYASSSDDVAFTSNILEKVQAELCIDRTRVYAAGYSNGGGFTSLLSCQLGEKFAAYVIISGAMYAPDGGCKPKRATPLLTIHGDRDAVIPFQGSIVKRVPAIDAWTKYRADVNGCKSQKTFNDGVHVIATDWEGCNNNASVQNIRILGGSHDWTSFNMDKAWQFLTRFSL